MAQIIVPDLGTTDEVDVIEIHISAGQTITKDDALITVEGEKATMDIPASQAGIIEKVLIAVGDKVKTGDVIAELAASAAAEETAAAETAPEEVAAAIERSITLPDLGTADDVDVIEVAVKVGDDVAADDTVLTLEGEKATMDIPAGVSGEILAVNVAVGDKVKSGTPILVMRVAAQTPVSASTRPSSSAPSPAQPASSPPLPAPATNEPNGFDNSRAHASPAVRRIAREFGIDLTKVTGTGRKGRILKIDCQNYVKNRLRGDNGGLMISPAPEVDFSQFGDIEIVELSKIKKLTGVNVHRSWVTIPHVTHFETANITEMEAFRQENKPKASEAGVKLTPLVFIMKAVVAALKEFPNFNASLDPRGEKLILKKYFHLGVAVDTPNGLVVPVIRDVDQKGFLEIARELGEISQKAREKGLSIAEMDGSCFTISSLGGIGGVGFTPIIKAPDVAILGVSKAKYEPVYVDDEFIAQLTLPFSLSYDHRVIDGAEAARFCQYLARSLADIRQLLL